MKLPNRLCTVEQTEEKALRSRELVVRQNSEGLLSREAPNPGAESIMSNKNPINGSNKLITSLLERK